MFKKCLKVVTLALSFVLLNQSWASADFYGPFAPSNWTFNGDASANSLTSSQMQIESSNIGGGIRTASYSINVPGNTIYVSFDYHYVTNDRDGSSYDLAKYSINGVTTNIVASNIPNGGTASGTLTFNNLAGTSFALIQEALDGILGSATITITNFSAVLKQSDYLVEVEQPKLNVSNGLATCTAGKYKFASGQVADISSLAYTLIVEKAPVSRVVFDPSNLISPHLFSSITHSVSGGAGVESAIWDVSKLSNYEAYCEVSVAKGDSMLHSLSNTFEDAAKTAERNAAAQAWEDQRSTATAANFTKDMREMRKRLAARQP
jgi:hypothetical protein